MRYRLVKKGLVLGIIVLLLAVIFTPNIYADVNKINHLLQKGGYSDATGSSELKLVRIRGWPSPDPNAPGIFIVGDVKNVGDAVFSDLIDRSGKIHPWLNPSKILAIDDGSWMGKISPGETSTVCNIYVEEDLSPIGLYRVSFKIKPHSGDTNTHNNQLSQFYLVFYFFGWWLFRIGIGRHIY
jgi:hypothetical protein